MIITGITVEGVGKFGMRTEITGLGPGVNLLSAGNEAGKSTLFRAVRACLFERHNTRNEIVRNLVTEGVSLPVTISLHFEHDSQAYTATKSFVKSPAASLMRGGTEIARGREADERICELLGIAHQSSRSVDEAAFGILWVGQGQSFRIPEPSEAATTALNAAIQAEVGTLVGGERARSVLSALKTELAPIVTDTGNPKKGGPLALATARLEVTQENLKDAEQKLSILDAQFSELAVKRNEGRRLGDPALLAQMKTDLSAAKGDLKAGDAAASQLTQFEAVEQQSKAKLDRTAERVADLEERRTRIDEDRKRSAEISEALMSTDQQSNAVRRVAQGARDEIAELDRFAEKDEEQERILQSLSGCVNRAANRPALIRQLSVLQELEERLVKNAAGLSGNRATSEIITALDKTEQESSVLNARLEASSPEVAIDVKPAGAGKVLVDGEPLANSAVQTAIDPIRIQVGDLATITVSAPAASNSDALKRRLQLQAQLSKILEDAGVANASELRAARSRREALEAESANLKAEISALGFSGTSQALAIERIRTELTEVDNLVEEALAQARLETLPSSQDIALQQEELRQKREQARRQRQRLDGTIEAQNKILSDLADTRGRLSGIQLEIKKRLDADLAILPDASRASLITEAEAAEAAARDDYRSKSFALEEQRNRVLPSAELQRRRIRADRLERSLESHATRLGSIEKEIANLEGQIQNAGGDGLGEKVEILRADLDLVEREVTRHQNRIETLTLLKQTIEACYKEQRDRLHAPLQRHLKPFLNDLFPSAELELADGFSIAAIKRGSSAETFERLSAGTQEQIAVLVRLAMGSMIGERGQQVPIILDDALVFSDDDRIEQMFDALHRASQTQQVIVLTCRTRAFAALGGRQLSIASSAPAFA